MEKAVGTRLETRPRRLSKSVRDLASRQRFQLTLLLFAKVAEFQLYVLNDSADSDSSARLVAAKKLTKKMLPQTSRTHSQLSLTIA